MEFDWLEVHYDLDDITAREIEESFEDPFSVRLLPEFEDERKRVRFFCLGKTLNNRPLFSVFWTDGKNYRVIAVREMNEAELNFYDRKNAELQ